MDSKWTVGFMVFLVVVLALLTETGFGDSNVTGTLLTLAVAIASYVWGTHSANVSNERKSNGQNNGSNG